jgi:hypothetical protein
VRWKSSKSAEAKIAFGDRYLAPTSHSIEKFELYLKLPRKRQQDPSKRISTEGGFIQAAQEEREMLDWAAVDRSIDSMNKPLLKVRIWVGKPKSKTSIGATSGDYMENKCEEFVFVTF